MKFEKIDEGFVRQNEAEEDGLISAGSRSALTSDGEELLCTYALTRELGTNDFVAVLSRSSDGGKTWSHEGPVFRHWRSQYSVAGSICAAPTGSTTSMPCARRSTIRVRPSGTMKPPG